MKTVFVCSPYSENPEVYTQVANAMCRLAIDEGAAPIAPHLLYTQFLDDSNSDDRRSGIAAGLAFLECCDEMWIYSEVAPSRGMREEVGHAVRFGGITTRWISRGDIEGCLQ